MQVKGPSSIQKQQQNILLIQLGDIGDVVLSLPAAKLLHDYFSGSALVMSVQQKAAGLLEDIPYISDVISIDKQKHRLRENVAYQQNLISRLRKGKFTLAVDLRTGTRGMMMALISGAAERVGRLDHGPQWWRRRLFSHLVQPDPEKELKQYASEHHLNILKPFGLIPKNKTPRLYVAQKKTDEISFLLNQEGVARDRAIVAVHPFTLWKYKEWDNGKWVSLISHLSGARDLTVIIIGAKDEQQRGRELSSRCRGEVYNLVGKTDIGALPALLQHCRLVVGVDSGVLHVAAAVDTPTIGLFGPTSPITWGPEGAKHLIVSKPWECAPCRQKGCQGTGVSRCLEELTYGEVKWHIDRLLSDIGLPTVAGPSYCMN